MTDTERREKFTPGPWSVQNGHSIYSELGGQSGDGIACDANDGWHIADIGENPTFWTGLETELGDETKEANARLIAAAPDLYNALNVLSKAAEARGIPADAAKAALAKARGEQS